MKFYTWFGQNGNRFYQSGYDDGVKFSTSMKIDNYPLYTTLKSDKFKKTKYTTIDKRPLGEISFSNFFDRKKFVKENKASYEFFGLEKPEYETIHREYPGAYGVPYDSSLIRTVFIDIETESHEGGYSSVDNPFQRINAISVIFRDNIYALGLGSYTPTEKNIKYLECKSEEQLLHSFFKLIRKIDPDVYSGWSVEKFDIPMLINRSKLVFGNDTECKKLSPFGILEAKEVRSKFGVEQVYSIYGCSILDYLPLYKKFQLTKLADYKLHTVATYELGEGKVDLSETGGMKSYLTDFNSWITYNIKDSILVREIDKKRKYIDLVSRIGMRSKTNYIDAFSQVRLWEQIIYTYLETEENVISPYKSNMDGNEVDTDQFQGAYVKPPIVGKHDWVVYYDFTSLYPHIIMQFNISPETYVGELDYVNVAEILSKNYEVIQTHYLEKSSYCMSGNGAMFRTDIKGFLPKIIEKMFQERKEAKDTMLLYEKASDTIKDILKQRAK